MTYRLLLPGTAVLVVLLSAVRVAVFWGNEAYLRTQAGVWAALAYDLVNGTFYRPLLGPLGYGGSPYFPLPFLLHGGLMKVTGEPIWSGYFVSLFSVGLLVAAVYALLRRLDARPVLAGSIAGFVLASQVVQDVLLSIRGDALPAGFGLWGAAFCVSATTAPLAIYAAALMFTLAFASKVTAVAALAAALAWLLLARRWRLAVQLAVATAVGCAVVIGLMYFASGGHAFDALRTVGGGARLRDVLASPLTLARLTRQEPETLVFVVLGFGAFVLAALRGWLAKNLASLLLLATTGITALIFAAEGTDTNHLVELFAVSLVVAGAVLARYDEFEWGAATLAVAVLAACLSLVSGLLNQQAEQRWGTVAQALDRVSDSSRPILAENPILSVARGEQPYVIDSFIVRLLRERNPNYESLLWDRLRHQAFAAVILERDPHSDRGREWYLAFFGEGFIEELERHYTLEDRVKSRVIYRPRRR